MQPVALPASVVELRRALLHCAEKHLHRYLAEFDFRYSNRVKLGVSDSERATKALKEIVGKRLTYRRTNERAEDPAVG